MERLLVLRRIYIVFLYQWVKDTKQTLAYVYDDLPNSVLVFSAFFFSFTPIFYTNNFI